MGNKQSVPEDKMSNTLQEILKNEGASGVKKYLDKNLNRWREEPVKFGIIGKTNTGKSTFINVVRGLKEGNEGFAKEGRGNTTQGPTQYFHPENEKIVFCDFPGAGTLQFPKENYIKTMELYKYDYFFIFFNDVLAEDDVWLAQQLTNLRKPFSFVRSMFDLDIELKENKGKSSETVMKEIRSRILSDVENCTDLKVYKNLFIISKEKEKGQFRELMAHIEDNITNTKLEAVLYSFKFLSKDSVEKKYNVLLTRVALVTAGTAAISAIPVPLIDVGINLAIVVNEVRHYVKVFGLTDDQLRVFTDLEFDRLKTKNIRNPNAYIFDIIKQQIGKIVAVGALVIAESIGDVILPIVGSVVSATTTATIVGKILNQNLTDCRDDALLINEHILSPN